MPPKKKKEYFSSGSDGYNFLDEQFNLYNQSGGRSGINPGISEKKDIDEIYNKYAVFQDYSKSTFPLRFKSLASQKQLGIFKDRKRLESPGKSSFSFTSNLLLIYILFLIISTNFISQI